MEDWEFQHSIWAGAGMWNLTLYLNNEIQAFDTPVFTGPKYKNKIDGQIRHQSNLSVGNHSELTQKSNFSQNYSELTQLQYSQPSLDFFTLPTCPWCLCPWDSLQLVAASVLPSGALRRSNCRGANVGPCAFGQCLGTGITMDIGNGRRI